MSEKQLKAFLDAVQADTYLQEKLSAATDADSVVSIAKESGFEIAIEEVKEAQTELSQESLKDVVGGVNWKKPSILTLKDEKIKHGVNPTNSYPF